MENEWPWYYNYVRYGGNDITKEKMEALISFLDGSYPVIVSDEFIEQPATFFETKGFTGRRATLGVGEYDAADLVENHIYADEDLTNVDDKEISSIKVKEGYRVTLHCGDKSVSFEDDVEDLSTIELASSETLTSAIKGGGKPGGGGSGGGGGGQGGNNSGDSEENTTASTWDNGCTYVKIEKIDNAQPVRAVDEDHIDNCTYLYEFVKTALDKKYTNFYAKSDIAENGSELLKFYLNRPKATMVGFTANGKKENSKNDVYYITSGANGKYNLQYSFTIQNEGAATADTKYDCKLYIDVNADGKFSDMEEVSDINITDKDGNRVSADALYAGKQYVLSREVPQGYKGLLPWKVEICQVNNKNIYASETGYTKLKGQDIEVLKICQIYWDGATVIKLNDEISKSNSYFNSLLDEIWYNGKKYYGIEDEFILDVTAISISEYEAKTNHKEYLKDFNMLILGFSDMYGDFSGNATTGAMGAIVEFINSGKSVLLSHDTTSFFNNPIKNGEQKGYPWYDNTGDIRDMHTGTRNAATLNTYIRPLVGMDRYGILEVAALKQGAALNESSDGWSDVINSRKDVAYKPKSGKKETVPEVHGYTYALISAKDHKVQDSTGLIQEFTKYEIYPKYANRSEVSNSWRFKNTYRNIRYNQVFFGEWDTDEDANSYGELYNVDNGQVDNVHATQVNKGQITEYPYKLEEEFEIAQTHAQYYELDYTADDDHDGQSDLVVWYCLGGRTSSGGKEETIYSQSPNDVRNNYYIYNKGNITYTGMGHSAKESNKYTEEEAKLFINTMIASYQAGVKAPYISVKENQYEINTMYRFYDQTNAMSIDGGEKVYFTVQDINFVKGTRTIEGHVYYNDDSSEQEITVDGYPKKVRQLDNENNRIYNAATGEVVDSGNLQSGGIYYIVVPEDVMERCSTGLTLYFEAQSVITSNSNTYITDKMYATLDVLQAYLFDLD